MSISELSLFPESGGHLQQRRPVMSRIQISQLQRPGEVVRLGSVTCALVAVLQSAEELAQPDVHLQLERSISSSLSDPMGVLEAVQRLPETGQLQVDASDGQVDVACGRTLLALVVERVTSVRESSGMYSSEQREYEF